MNVISIILSALAGYLIGSISFARIVIHLFGPTSQVQDINLAVPDSEARFHSDSVSATTVNVHLGPRYGCLTSLLDMVKVGLPALLLWILFPGTLYYLIFLALGTLGHNWPIYYGFKGGRGMSTILPGMILVDWLGLLVSLSISLLVGWIRNESYVWNRLTILLMIPWVWVRHQSWELLGYVVAVNVMYQVASIPEMKEIGRLRKEGQLGDFLRTPTLLVEDEQQGGVKERESFIGMLRSLLSKKPPRTEKSDPEP